MQRGDFPRGLGLNFRLLHHCQNDHASYELPKAESGEPHTCEVDTVLSPFIETGSQVPEALPRGDGGVNTYPSVHEVCMWPDSMQLCSEDCVGSGSNLSNPGQLL